MGDEASLHSPVESLERDAVGAHAGAREHHSLQRENGG
jgi:hypothetical protein